MGLFSFFKPTGKPNPAVFLLSYTFCYRGLPKIFFANPTNVVLALQKDATMALRMYISTFLDEYLEAMPAARGHIPTNFPSMFSAEVREVDANLGVVLITLPRPPEHPVELQPGKPILAPYFAAILFESSSLAKSTLFVLSQNLREGTTLRSVCDEKSHGNCMASCKPDLEEFLSLLVLMQRDGIHAARKKYPWNPVP